MKRMNEMKLRKEDLLNCFQSATISLKPICHYQNKISYIEKIRKREGEVTSCVEWNLQLLLTFWPRNRSTDTHRSNNTIYSIIHRDLGRDASLTRPRDQTVRQCRQFLKPNILLNNSADCYCYSAL